ncbi:hypothetical protein HGRIS_009712 [Hohenbuehelia grisea]|uniref:FAD-binding FR-type domain-containing protein n=1 Tax=Hohenbuehelia grisea TaxID=104357 RepID=A0ABR3J241_9AGAR
MSRAESPLSASTTLSVPPSPKLKGIPSFISDNVYQNPHIPASNLIEWISSRSATSSTVYIYDVAEQAGFGTLTKQLSSTYDDTTLVIDIQTRPGAGLSLLGRLSQGTSQDALKGSVLTAYTTPRGLSVMAPSLSHLPAAQPDSRLVLQVPTVSTAGETYFLSPTLADLAATLPFLPQDVAILLSASPQESVDFATLAYALKKNHVVHLFDHFSSSREVGHPIVRLPELTEGDSLSTVIKNAGYNLFEYEGDTQARVVFVFLNGPLALAARAVVKAAVGVGIVIVKVLRPWGDEEFQGVIPSTAEVLHVFDEVPNSFTRGLLFTDVFTSVLQSHRAPIVETHPVTPTLLKAYLSEQGSLQGALSRIHPSILPAPAPLTTTKKILLFSTPDSPQSAVSQALEDLFLSNNNIATRLLTDHDMLSKQGGIVADRLILGRIDADEVDIHTPIPFSFPLGESTGGEADFTAILDQSLLKSHDLLQYAKPGSPVLLVGSWSTTELGSNLPPSSLELIASRKLRVWVIDAHSLACQLVGSSGSATDAVQNLLIYVAFLRLYLGKSAKESLTHAMTSALFPASINGVQSSQINAEAWAALTEVTVEAPHPSSETTSPLLKHFEPNIIAVEREEGETLVNGARLETWRDAAKHFIFSGAFTPSLDVSSQPEEYPANPALRPEVPDRTFLVTCTVNRRLTPLEYDRNVFHLEFDTSGTGLKYAIGEALGVHGWNDAQDVLEFCQWYGADPDRLITIPIVAGEDRMHTRTVFQALQQQIDLFGQPPKSFYSDLAPYATSSVDKHALQFIGSPEGSATFKKLSEKDTVHFLDVLKMYPSARPGIEVLCTLIGDIKPRHYSIASAQAVVGNRVDLLVVTVDWLTPSGSPRYGQCTRYLAGLKVGQKVTVSIKPSVMKLPPDDAQPIIMAGLGTGAAPFRAFLQYRAWLSQQGRSVGPTYYYFGSRHQSQEYLYGEEIEAFILDGTITRAGLAFSRDGPKKVYIQHKMREDAEVLARMLREQQGVFYLCGPTWPVPDVYEALVGALTAFHGLSAEEAGEYLEDLKEEERYVLEVY